MSWFGVHGIWAGHDGSGDAGNAAAFPESREKYRENLHNGF
jgi:hypothetical protein